MPSDEDIIALTDQKWVKEVIGGALDIRDKHVLDMLDNMWNIDGSHYIKDIDGSLIIFQTLGVKSVKRLTTDLQRDIDLIWRYLVTIGRWEEKMNSGTEWELTDETSRPFSPMGQMNDCRYKFEELYKSYMFTKMKICMSRTDSF